MTEAHPDADNGTEIGTGEAATAADAATDTPASTEVSAEANSGGESDAVTYWKRRARENEQRAKSNHDELEQLRRESMSDQERAIAEARDTTRSETLREVAGRLVDAEVRSASVNRPVNVDALLDGLDRSRFLTEDGEVDRDAVSTWLDQLAPAQQPPRVASDLGQGARGVNRSNPDDMFGELIASKLRK